MKPKIGDYVCNCRYEHLKIIHINLDDDSLTLEDGSQCSYKHCCDEVNYDWTHPYVD